MDTRRDFLKKGLAGALALGAMAVPMPVLAKTAPVKRTGKDRARRVVLISLDGICVEGFLKARTPNLDSILESGTYSIETRVVMPSVTLPNWTSHLTGSGPEQHGVVDNGWEISNFKLPPVAKDADGYYPSVFKVLKDNIGDMKTAFYYNWAPLINPYNKKYIDDHSYLEDDAYVPNYDRALEFISVNREYPSLVFLYSVHTDHAGHKYKWMSPEYISSIEEADVQIGRFLDTMKQEGLYDDTHFMFLTDHGGIEYGHGGVSTHEMIVPWAICGPGIKKNFKMDGTNNTVNTAAVILHLFGVARPDCWTGEVPECIG